MRVSDQHVLKKLVCTAPSDSVNFSRTKHCEIFEVFKLNRKYEKIYIGKQAKWTQELLYKRNRVYCCPKK